jgi:AcrR family transcriptional regulator
MTKDTKNLILKRGMDIASQIGLVAISIGELAKAIPMSKSGLFAHFNSKENLQLAILEYAGDLFKRKVVLPALKEKRGIPRIQAIIKNWKQWVIEHMPGSCIFVSAAIDFEDRPGIVRDFLLKQQKQWIESLSKVAESAIKAGDFRPDINCRQFAFDIYSLLMGFHYYQKLLADTDTQKYQQNALNMLLANYKSSASKPKN